MSQSDYLKNKKIATILKEQADLDSVLSADLYTSFKTKGTLYALKNTNTIPTYSQLASETTHHNQYDCSSNTFILDKLTNTRPNRKLNTADPMGYARRYGFNEYNIYQKVNMDIKECKMFKECDEHFHMIRNKRFV